MGLKSPSDGRWDGRCRTGFCDEPMHREEEERPHQDVFGIDWLMGNSPWQMAWTMMDRTPLVMIGRFPGHVAALIS
jgi:hypothetical protein